MKKFLFFSLFFFSIIYNSSFVMHNPLYADDVTILTYYPAPYGVYQNLKATSQLWIGQDANGLPLTGGGALLSVGGVDNNIFSRIYANSSRDDTSRLYGIYAITTNNGTPQAGSTDIAYGMYGVAHNNTDGVSYGVRGETDDNTDNSAGLYGISTGIGQKTYGVFGTSRNGIGVYGFSTNNNGINGESQLQNGIYGKSASPTGSGVLGESTTTGSGVVGTSTTGTGVYGRVDGDNSGAFGVYGYSKYSYGVYAYSGRSHGLYAKTDGAPGSCAGYFIGDVYIEKKLGIGTTSMTKSLNVNGTIMATRQDITNGNATCWGNAAVSGSMYELGYDVAELFSTSEEVEISDVLVIGENRTLKKSTKPYETSVAGIVSGAPAVLFEDGQLQISPEPFEFQKGKKPPVALAGRVLANVSTENGTIEAGDLLVTSSIPGHAMKAKPIGELNGHPIYPQGCIVGKALEPLKEGKGKILVLVCLM